MELKTLQQEKANIEHQAKECARKLNRSYELLSSLKTEHLRWKLMIAELKVKEKNTIGDSLLAAGFVAYFGKYHLSPKLEESVIDTSVND